MDGRSSDHPPFRFSTQLSLVELTGLSAGNLEDLLTHLRSVPGSVLFYHTHHFLKQHQALSPEPPNDFAFWVTHVLQEERVGEQLASIDTVRFSSLRALRDALVGVLDRAPFKKSQLRSAPAGQEFHFMKARSFVFNTPYEVHTLEEFAEALSKISLNSIYHHVFEARLRLERATNDFSNWLDSALGETALARAITRLDPYTITLDALRQHLLRLIQIRIQERALAKDSHASR